MRDTLGQATGCLQHWRSECITVCQGLRDKEALSKRLEGRRNFETSPRCPGLEETQAKEELEEAEKGGGAEWLLSGACCRKGGARRRTPAEEEPMQHVRSDRLRLWPKR